MDNTVTANPGSNAGSESAGPSTALDSPENLTFWEPEDDQAKPEVSAERIEKATETDEATEGGQESDTGEEPEEQAEPAAVKLTDDTLVDLGDEKVSLREIKDRGLRERDYQLKRANDAAVARQVRSQAENLQQSVTALADYLASALPPEPDPALLYGTPEQRQWFHDQDAMFKAAQAKLHEVLQHSRTAQAVQNEVSQVERAQRLNMAAETLAADPDVGSLIRDQAKAKQFFETAYKAAEANGFSRQELQAYTDPRAFKMAYLAGLGKQWLEARAKANSKVERVPPVVAPQKGKQPNSADRRNQEAMARLRKSGSKSDALKVDFE